ncbi:hypothetical protein ABPG75_007757 [Micractinium tetrahymenae]
MSDAQLAALVQTLPHSGQLTELRLTWRWMTPNDAPHVLGSTPLPAPITRVLRSLSIKGMSHPTAAFQPPDLACCPALESLDLCLTEGNAELHEGITQLRRLSQLRVWAHWQEVPAVLAQLPLRMLSLQGCQFPQSTSQERLHGGMRALVGLSPTLQALEFQYCKLRALPVVLSSLTGLTSLRCRGADLLTLPAWLTLLTAS